jgi:hypothetical protein
VTAWRRLRDWQQAGVWDATKSIVYRSLWLSALSPHRSVSWPGLFANLGPFDIAGTHWARRLNAIFTSILLGIAMAVTYAFFREAYSTLGAKYGWDNFLVRLSLAASVAIGGPLHSCRWRYGIFQGQAVITRFAISGSGASGLTGLRPGFTVDERRQRAPPYDHGGTRRYRFEARGPARSPSGAAPSRRKQKRAGRRPGSRPECRVHG